MIRRCKNIYFVNDMVWMNGEIVKTKINRKVLIVCGDWLASLMHHALHSRSQYFDPGGHPVYFWVGVCRWEFEALALYQTMFSWFLQPYTRLDTVNPYPIPDLHFLELYHYQCFNGNPSVNNDAAMILFRFRKASFSSEFLFLFWTKFIITQISFPANFLTLSQTKLLENPTLHSGTYLYSSYMGVPPPPGVNLPLRRPQTKT